MVDWRTLADQALEATVVGSFTRIGHAARQWLDHWDRGDPHAMAGRVVVVTGATTGLGRATAQALVGMGARVRIIGRDADRTHAAAREIGTHGHGADVDVHLADIADLDAVCRVVEEIRGAEARVDVLVNNAGALLAQRQVSPQGYEMSLATMVLGPLVLTEGLLDRLTAPSDHGPGRVVNVASGGMYTQRLALDDLQCAHGYRGSVAYARAKRALVVLGELWAQQWSGRPVVVHSMHPGWARTPGVHASLPTFERIVGPLLRTPEQGADTIVWLARAAEPARSTGRFWHDRRPRPTHRLSRTRETPEERAALWRRLHELAGQPCDPVGSTPPG